MFCYQCETAAQGTGCSKVGVCGKQPTTSDLQDLLVYAIKGVSFWAHQARQKDARSTEIDRFVIEALFTTVTNVDFADDSVVTVIAEAVALREKARQLYETANGGAYTGPVPAAAQNWTFPADRAGQLALAQLHGVKDPNLDADLQSMQHNFVWHQRIRRLCRPRHYPRT